MDGITRSGKTLMRYSQCFFDCSIFEVNLPVAAENVVEFCSLPDGNSDLDKAWPKASPNEKVGDAI